MRQRFLPDCVCAQRESVSFSLCPSPTGEVVERVLQGKELATLSLKFSSVSVHSSLVVLHFAEKETGDHFSCFPIQKDAGKHGFREKNHM